MSNKEVFALVCYFKMHILVAYSSDSYKTSREILSYKSGLCCNLRIQCTIYGILSGNSAIQHFWIVWKCDCYFLGVFMA